MNRPEMPQDAQKRPETKKIEEHLSGIVAQKYFFIFYRKLKNIFYFDTANLEAETTNCGRLNIRVIWMEKAITATKEILSATDKLWCVTEYCAVSHF